MLLEFIAAHRRAKLSQAIRAGQAKALVAGKRINRPKVPRRIRNGIPSALTMVTGSDLGAPVQRQPGERRQHPPRDDDHRPAQPECDRLVATIRMRDRGPAPLSWPTQQSLLDFGGRWTRPYEGGKDHLFEVRIGYVSC
jgi:hypothetical protein